MTTRARFVVCGPQRSGDLRGALGALRSPLGHLTRKGPEPFVESWGTAKACPVPFEPALADSQGVQ